MPRGALRWSVFVGLFLSGIAIGAVALAQAGDPVPFPKGYREWTRVRTVTALDEKHPLFKVFPGMHHVYANPKAMAGLKSGAAFQDGSILILDLFGVSDSSGAIAEGSRKLLAVMVRDAARFKDTQGWGFEVFDAGKKEKRKVKSAEDAKACLACHQERAAQRFVFSELKE